MKRFLAALPLLLPLQAQAAPQVQQLSCAFTQECIDLLPCQDTGTVIQMIYTPGPDAGLPIAAEPDLVPPDPFSIAVQEETESFNAVPLTGGKLHGPMQGFIAFNKAAVQRLLTIAPDGTARYSVHKPLEGIALYYQGTCEEVK